MSDILLDIRNLEVSYDTEDGIVHGSTGLTFRCAGAGRWVL